VEEYKQALDTIKPLVDNNIKEMFEDIKQLSKPMLQKLLIWHRKTFGALCKAMPVLKSVEAPVIEAKQ